MTLRKHCLMATLAAALAVLPTSAAEPTQLDLQRAIDSLEKATAELKNARKDLADVQSLHHRVIRAESEATVLRVELADLKKRVESQSVTALKPYSPTPTSTSFRGMGRVRFINEHPNEMTVAVNGLAYRLTPGQEKLIPVTPGAYTYQVLQIHTSPRIRQITADETKTFTIYAPE